MTFQKDFPAEPVGVCVDGRGSTGGENSQVAAVAGGRERGRMDMRAIRGRRERLGGG